MNDYDRVIKVLKLKNSIYYTYNMKTDTYQEISEDYFNRCKNRFDKIYD